MITVNEIWPYAAVAGPVISSITGLYYADLLRQIMETKQDTRLLRVENEQLRETIRQFNIPLNSVAASAIETKNMIGQLLQFEPPTPRRRGQA